MTNQIYKSPKGVDLIRVVRPLLSPSYCGGCYFRDWGVMAGEGFEDCNSRPNYPYDNKLPLPCQKIVFGVQRDFIFKKAL